MANRYWIGNGGSISDTAHWSTTSGGSGGASISTTDDMFFDANSFTLPNQTVTLGYSCNNFNSTGVTNTPTFSGGGLSITGNLICPGIVWQFGFADGSLSLVAFQKTITLTTGGTLLPKLAITGSSGVINLTDTLTLGGQQYSFLEVLTITPGAVSTTINTNGNAINCYGFTIQLGSGTTILDNSTITITGALSIAPGANISAVGTTWILSNGSSASIDGTSSAITLLGNSSDRLTITNNSGSSKTISNSTLTNTVLNGTHGFNMVEIIDGGGNDWGDGGGGTGNPTRLYHVKVPPTHVSLP